MKKLRTPVRAGLACLAVSVAVWLGPLRARQQSAASPPDTSSLTGQQKAVLEYLLRDWGKTYRTTSIGLAAEVNQIALSDESRLRLARFLELNRSSYSCPARYGAVTLALTPVEKRTARALLLREERNPAGATSAELAADLRLSAQSMERRLAFLKEMGVIVAAAEGNNRRYKAAARFARRPTREIDFFSHQVEVNRTDKFEVA